MVAGWAAVLMLWMAQAAPAYAQIDVLEPDSVVVPAPRPAGPSLNPDDSLATYGRIRQYVLPFEERTPHLFDPPSPFLQPRSNRSLPIALDSTQQGYTLEPTARLPQVRGPMTLSDSTYRNLRFEADMRESWRALTEARLNERQQRGGLGVNIVVPGGRQSAFSTIFGKPQVDLRVTGQADINAGFAYQKSDRQAAITGQAGQIDPDFKQDLRLGITGTIGDKMRINVDWDTNNEFDYQNQVQLQYTGYDDEIIQSIEAGNVFLETPSSLISGGQSLFGIKSEFQIGNLRLTTIASQQEGQSNSLTIEGGAEKTTFDLQPTDYDDNRHFFVGYYFRNRWEPTLENLPQPTLGPGFNGIVEIEVWRKRVTAQQEDDRRAVALVDLGEESQILALGSDYTTDEVLPNEDVDQYDEGLLNQLRNGAGDETSTVDNVLASVPGLGAQDYESGSFYRLREGVDYTIDDELGYISLKQRLSEQEALAVSFRYRRVGTSETVTVGDFASESGGTIGGSNSNRLVLKLLRPSTPVPPAGATTPAVWYLQMRNIYDLRGRGFNEDNFELDVFYAPPGQTETTTVPELGSTPLIQLLGLDRLNQNLAPGSDNQFDFLAGLTIDQQEGLLIFPYLEPFGGRIASLISQGGGTPDPSNPIIFSDLYALKREIAQNETESDVYRIRGSYKGTVQEFYDLRAFAGVVEGSVRVRSAGTELQEGTDYVVDYQGGTVTITNPTYLTTGRDVQISYEQNSFANLQKKTLLGARADYAVRDRFALGATVMRLSENSPVDKFRIGEEPIRNTIWGVDGSMALEPRWLTRAVDALPLVQTRARSAITVSGEFAQLRPGHTDTDAFARTRDNLQDIGSDFASDELGGVSFVDDFEGFENTFSLRQQLSAWQVSAPPIEAVGEGTSSTPVALSSSRRASFAWYQVNRNIIESLSDDVEITPAVRQYFTSELFPERDLAGSPDAPVPLLDIYFNPFERGPYNFLGEGEAPVSLQEFIVNSPEDNWGGFTQRIPEGYKDFSLQNVEFVEFIFKPFPEGSDNDEAVLYLNLGTISEDVIPNGRLNTEDGLSATSSDNYADGTREATGQTNDAIDITGNRTEDLGLDGLASYDPASYDPGALEAVQFNDFLARVEGEVTSDPRVRAEINRTRRDPSADDYHYFSNDAYFDNSDFFPGAGGANFQQRFSRYFQGQELNSFEGQNELAQNVTTRRGISRTPDSEDIDFDLDIEQTNSYYQYRIPLDPAELERLADPLETEDFIVGRVGNPSDPWYKVRIPVQTDRKESVGDIQAFNTIEFIRLWTKGHRAPMTLRFAALELVGSQWRASESIIDDDGNPDVNPGEATLRVSSINNEEDPVYEQPIGAIVARSQTAGGQQQRTREQSLVLEVENLDEQAQRGVFKTYGRGFDFLKYSNLRMYAHLHGSGLDVNPRSDAFEPDDDIRLFIRLGANETRDYYEYEQPLEVSPIPTGDETPQVIWPDENAVNLELSALNELKVARDRDPDIEGTQTVYSSDEAGLATDFAPAGTKLYIKGTPSLRNITTIVIGMRNVSTSEVIEEAVLWANELRVSGYDETKGWAALVNTRIDLADFANVEASFQTQTDGFGSLSSTLNERQQSDNLNWSLRTSVRADKLLPERQGWDVPVSVQASSVTETPRFDPNRGDVRLEEIYDQIEQGAEPTTDDVEATKDAVLRAAQTKNERRSVTVGVQKSGSESWLLRNTIDGLSLNYSYSTSDARSPSLLLNDSWEWNASMDYRLSFGRPRTLKPLWFLEGVPVFGAVGSIEFNYVPQSIGFFGSANRSFSQRRNRSVIPTLEEERYETRIQSLFREQQTFTHSRTFDLQYNPFNFLRFNYGTNTQQSLYDLGLEGGSNGSPERTDIILFVPEEERDDPDIDFRILTNTTPEEAGLDPETDQFTVERRLDLTSTSNVLSGILSGEAPRTNRYRQNLTSTFRPGFLSSEAFNWIDLQDVVYQTGFTWENGAAESNTGASISNSVDIRSGVTLHPNRVWERFGFYDSLKRRMEEVEREKQAARDERRRRREEGRTRRTPGVDDVPSDTTGTAEGEEENGETGPTWGDILPDPVNLLSRFALTFLDIPDISVAYSGDRTARSSNVGRDSTDTDYTLLDAFQGRGPSLDYRLGFERRVSATERIIEGFRPTDQLRDGNRIEARTTLAPSSSFQVNLDWDTQWSRDEQVSYSRETIGGPINVADVESGSNQVTVWAFRASYLDLVQRQLDTFRGDLNAEGAFEENGDGRVVLTNASVADDFRGAFVSSLGTAGQGGFLPFPMPGWRVTYSGLTNWPVFRSLAQSASLRHSYRAEYSTSFSETTALDDQTFTLAGASGPINITYTPADFETGRAEVSERYQPLIGLDLAWFGGLETDISWNQGNLYRLSTASLKVEELKTSELTLRLGFRKRGLRLPLLSGSRLNNEVNLSVTVSRAVNDERSFSLRRAIDEAAQTPGTYDINDATTGDNVAVLRETTRLSIAPRLGYRFSNRVSADFLLEYERFEGDSRQPSFTNINGGFNIQVSLADN